MYNTFWSQNALHYGLWEKDTKRLSEAIENTNRFVSRLLGVTKNDYLLDAGCGVGGSSIFIAKEFGTTVKGITLSEKQMKQAVNNSKNKGVQDLVSFEIMDFNKTRFSDNTFTGIFAVESFCHSEDKPRSLREMYRLLKPGGRLVVVDGFLTKRKLTERERGIYQKCLTGWGIVGLMQKEDFMAHLKRTGFKRIHVYDRTDEVVPSSRRIFWYGMLFFPFSLVLSKLGLIPRLLHDNSVCMINQQKTFNNFTGYYAVVAEK